jgi:hypothetical protein
MADCGSVPANKIIFKKINKFAKISYKSVNKNKNKNHSRKLKYKPIRWPKNKIIIQNLNHE